MQPGDLVAVRDGGDRLIYDYTDEEGIQFGQIERGADKFDPRPLLSIIARGYWNDPAS